MKHIVLILNLILFAFFLKAESPYPVRGLCISAPSVEEVDTFVNFINNELAPAGLNLLILRIEYNYEYELHPELRSDNPLTKADVKRLVNVCRKNNIRLLPQVNLLGHQSWHGKAGKLLEVYPEFDETPDVKLPEHYEWPNADGLYCKSYCPLHPEVHDVVFDIVDEITDAFESDAFHAGMDEVFYIGHEQCPRCYGKDPAELFAGEVSKIRNHLKETGKELWIWGDRLIDGKTTGIGIWEASFNNTHRAIDMIPKDVVICDWHYERPDPTAVLFASKGLHVLTCPWQNAENAVKQEEMTRNFIKTATKEMKPRYLGMLQTVWGSTKGFMESYKGTATPERADKSAECFRELTRVWK
ncbi:family 20 glycosylhydrolase [Maribellus comscasis]|uniref:beta-N-acetylhexosaminidase n=1 Tax=Maribellus comscasis TaxID=2681766 RepID=A0A6I6JNL8_9BACT|nr:family 20 glycosylhydrolase [Maribellus comscasis]QGY42668.1 family 20 glycosylhydrolase [Maribellus comscasis]